MRFHSGKIPNIVESLIETRVKELIGLDSEEPLSGKALKALAGKVKELSDYFIKKQEERPALYLKDRGLMAAYLAYFVPSNLLKVFRPLNELARHPRIALADDGKVSILDLGCGPGTASLGLLAYFSLFTPRADLENLEITAVDRVEENLSEVARLIYGFSKAWPGGNGPAVTCNKMKADIASFAGKGDGRRYRYILLSNALVEMMEGDDSPEEGAVFLETVAEKFLEADGSLLVIEPALRETARPLHQIRDVIIDRGELNLYSPCLKAGLCGALENPKDWCHEADGWEAPPLVKKLDSLTGLDKSRLNYAYLVLRKDGASLSDIPEYSRDTFRVVSDLRVMKGEKRGFLCGGQGRIEVGRLDRNKSESNAAFDGLKRGGIVRIEGLVKKGTLFRIGKEAQVSLFSS